MWWLVLCGCVCVFRFFFVFCFLLCVFFFFSVYAIVCVVIVELFTRYYGVLVVTAVVM